MSLAVLGRFVVMCVVEPAVQLNMDLGVALACDEDHAFTALYLIEINFAWL